MAFPTLVGSGAAVGSGSAISPALPTGLLVGDILLLFLETANQAITIPTPNGGTWTEVTNSPQGTGPAGGLGATQLTIFWSRYNGTQGNPTTSDSGDHQIGRIYAFRGCKQQGDPWNITSGNIDATSDTSMSANGATTTVIDCLVIVAGAVDDDGVAFGAWTNGDLANITDRDGGSSTAGNDGRFRLMTGQKAAAGTYGASTNTLTVASVKGMMTIALAPEPLTSRRRPWLEAVRSSWETVPAPITGRKLAPETPPVVVVDLPFRRPLQSILEAWRPTPDAITRRARVTASIDNPPFGLRSWLAGVLSAWKAPEPAAPLRRAAPQEVVNDPPFGLRAWLSGVLSTWKDPDAPPPQRRMVPETPAADQPFGLRGWLSTVLGAWAQADPIATAKRSVPQEVVVAEKPPFVRAWLLRVIEAWRPADPAPPRPQPWTEQGAPPTPLEPPVEVCYPRVAGADTGFARLSPAATVYARSGLASSYTRAAPGSFSGTRLDAPVSAFGREPEPECVFIGYGDGYGFDYGGS